MSTTMKAVRVHNTGGPEVLKYEDVELPSPKHGEVLVKNLASGVNFIDTYHRTGLYKLSLPTILGREGAGVVERVGEGVDDLSPGDVITYLVSATYAEYAIVPTSKAYKLPPGISPELGAAALLQGLTAHYLCTTTFPLNSSHTALIHAGAGGLGQVTIQIAKALGAKVITTVSSDAKAEIVRQLGADLIINYTTDDFLQQAKSFTGGEGVDVVYDSVGASTYQKSMDSLKPLGYLVVCGNSSGPVPPIDPQTLMEKGSLFLTRPTLSSYVATREAFVKRCTQLFGWIQTGKVKFSDKPTTFPLSQAAEAHRLLESRMSTGKILLIP